MNKRVCDYQQKNAATRAAPDSTGEAWRRRPDLAEIIVSLLLIGGIVLIMSIVLL